MDEKLQRKEIPLNGKLITGEDPVMIGPNFRELVNMRYTATHPEAIGGHSKINSTPLAYPKIRSGIHFRKDRPEESHIMVESYDELMAASNIYQNTTAIPNQGGFTSSLFSPSSGAIQGRWSLSPDGYVAYANGEDVCVWGGDESQVGSFINYDPADTFFRDLTDQITNLSPSGDIALLKKATDTYLYVGSIMPIEGIKFYISTPNTTVSSSVVYYWSGTAWVSVSDQNDETDVGGVSFAQTGTISFSTTKAISKIKEIKGVFLYWYKIKIIAPDDNIGVYGATVKTTFQPIKDIWDGEQRKIVACYRYDGSKYIDYTIEVRESDYDSSDDRTYTDLDPFTTSNSLIVGFDERQAGLRINIVSDKANDTAATTATIKYWNGSSFVTVGAISDGTAKGGISFAASGLITWNQLDDGVEFLTEFTGQARERNASQSQEVAKSPALYFYSISFDKDLSGDADGKLYVTTITGVPAQKKITGYKFPLHAMGRLWLFSERYGEKNKSICSSESTTNVFNGEDSVSLLWGDESEIVSSAWLYSQYGASIYSILLVFKKNEMWALIGNDPEEWKQYRVSATIGCVAPETLRVVDLPEDKTQGVNRSSIAIFQGANGIYLTDGRPPVLISNDIKDFFDKRKNKINQSLISNSFAFVDQEKMEYHWCFAQGDSIDSEMVFDFSKMKWFEIQRPYPLQSGIEVEDINGVTYAYGSIDTGHILKLENGNTFDGSDINCTMFLGDIAIVGDGSVTIETTVENHNLIAVSKGTENNITVTHYGDTRETGTEIQMGHNKTGFRTIRTSERPAVMGPHIFHSWKFNTVSNDQVLGFEPLFFSCLYKIVRNYIKDYRS